MVTEDNSIQQLYNITTVMRVAEGTLLVPHIIHTSSVCRRHWVERYAAFSYSSLEIQQASGVAVQYYSSIKVTLVQN